MLVSVTFLPAVAGIYAITNTLTGEQYVGQSANMAGRQADHLSALLRGNHPCKPMQQAFSRDGFERFTWTVLEELPGADSRTLLSRERDWMEEIGPVYAGGSSYCKQPPPSAEAIARAEAVRPVADPVPLMRNRQWDHEACMTR